MYIIPGREFGSGGWSLIHHDNRDLDGGVGARPSLAGNGAGKQLLIGTDGDGRGRAPGIWRSRGSDWPGERGVEHSVSTRCWQSRKECAWAKLHQGMYGVQMWCWGPVPH